MPVYRPEPKGSRKMDQPEDNPDKATQEFFEAMDMSDLDFEAYKKKFAEDSVKRADTQIKLLGKEAQDANLSH